ncbi:hypothetical protein HY750_03680 [Candidatus Kuenenbacteria bacterium]|nr:hypothetical protein [Candidatus Kuenenbacteria bacterium]
MKLIKQIKIFKNIQPREKWLEQTRDVFLMQAKEGLAFEKHRKEISLDNKYLTSLVFLKLFLKPIGALAMVAILFFSGSTFAIQAAKNTAPGDPLYIIKINLEKTEKILTNNKEKKVNLAIKSSNERLKELKKLSHSAPSIKNDKNIKTATQNLNEGMKEIKVSLNDLKEESNSKTTVETAKTVDAQTVKYEKELIQTKKEASPLIKEEIEKVLNSVEETSSHALQTIINEQEITKENSVVKNEATDIIENKIKQTEEKIEEVKNKAVDLAEVSKAEILAEVEQGGGQIDQIDSQKIEENNETTNNQQLTINNEEKKQENIETINNQQSTINNKTQKQEDTGIINNQQSTINNEAQKQDNKKIVDSQKIEVIKVEGGKEIKTQEQENIKTLKQEDVKIQESVINETQKQENTKTQESTNKIKQTEEKIEAIKVLAKEKSQEIIKETNKAEAILKEVKETLKQKDLNKVDLNIIADKIAVSKKLTNIANKVADKAIKQ